MKKLMIILTILLSFILVTAVYAANSYPWKNHAHPYTYLFGNHIDTHQQSQLVDQDKLAGFFYIKYTGEETEDGVPKAEHGDCQAEKVDCTVGWKLKGVAIQATLLEKPAMKHPVWCVDPADMPRSRGFSHFHWDGAPEHARDLVVGNTYEGYLLKLTAVDEFFFEHHGGFWVTPGIDTATHGNVETDC